MLTPLLKPASAEGTFELVVLEKEKVIAKIHAVANQRIVAAEIQDQKTMSSDLAAFVAAYYFCTFPARAPHPVSANF
jgi:hypothetical protein